MLFSFKKTGCKDKLIYKADFAAEKIVILPLKLLTADIQIE